jgi:hypothetical protein
MPEISATVAYLSGTIQRLSDSRFYAVIPGRRGCLTSYKTTQPDAAFRQAYNYLRRDAGLPKLPRLCSQCGERSTWKQSHKCMACSAPKRYTQKMPVLDTETPLPEVKGNLRTPANDASNAQNGAIAVKADDTALKAVQSKLVEARKCADAMIVQRGGHVPYSPSFDEYLYQWQLERSGS